MYHIFSELGIGLIFVMIFSHLVFMGLLNILGYVYACIIVWTYINLSFVLSNLSGDPFTRTNPWDGSLVTLTLGDWIITLLALLSILAVLFLSITSSWKIFKKAGLSGWKSLIPIYNTYCIILISRLPKWCFFILPLLIFVLLSFLNLHFMKYIFSSTGHFLIYIFFPLAVFIYLCYRLARSFGKGIGFALGLVFLPFIFFPLLAFGDAEYESTSPDDTLGVTPPASVPSVV